MALAAAVANLVADCCNLESWTSGSPAVDLGEMVGERERGLERLAGGGSPGLPSISSSNPSSEIPPPSRRRSSLFLVSGGVACADWVAWACWRASLTVCKKFDNWVWMSCWISGVSPETSRPRLANVCCVVRLGVVTVGLRSCCVSWSCSLMASSRSFCSCCWRVWLSWSCCWVLVACWTCCWNVFWRCDCLLRASSNSLLQCATLCWAGCRSLLALGCFPALVVTLGVLEADLEAVLGAVLDWDWRIRVASARNTSCCFGSVDLCACSRSKATDGMAPLGALLSVAPELLDRSRPCQALP